MKDINCKHLGWTPTDKCLECFISTAKNKEMQAILWGANHYISRVECKAENCLEESASYVKVPDNENGLKTELDEYLDVMIEGDPAAVFEVEGEVFICVEEMKKYYKGKVDWKKFIKSLEREDYEFMEAEGDKTYYKRYRRKT